jgi:membrane protease YdiL (CAAX protease family)
MKKLQIGLALSGFSFFAILILRFVRVPFLDPDGNASNIASFLIMGAVFYFLMRRFKLPSLIYFRAPRFTPISTFAIFFAIAVLFASFAHEKYEMKPWSVAIPGILFLLSIGIGEELVARGFVYGVLKERSNKAAILVSSLLFGLMHLNLYTGSDWDPWLAYWHVASAFCFGFFMCALLIATESIWVPVLAHALFDWGVVFDKTPPVRKDLPPISFPFWDGLASPFADFIFLFLPGLIIFFFMKPRRIWAPRWFKSLALRIALHWKLVDETEDKSELVGQY